MGIVTGSFHMGGGPPPGLYTCIGATITVTTLKGSEVVATAQVGSTESYAIAVPAGAYLMTVVTTDIIVNGQPTTLFSREISVSAGSTKEISVEYGIP
jgi:hypothetical protein